MRESSSGFILEFLHLDTGKITTIAEIEDSPSLYIDVSPDRNWLLFSKYDREEADIMLIENFR